MSSYIRRFLFDPGVETLIDIESVNILDLEPPAEISGVGSGAVLSIGEFENGPFGVATELFSASDFKSTFGTFGYEYDGVAGGNPSARVRNADAAVKAEYWNGNGFVNLANKKFARLMVLRIDTSVGDVTFTRLPCLVGSTAPTFSLVTGQTLDFDPGGGPLSAVFTGVAAATVSGAGVYPTTFTGGEKMTIAIDSLVSSEQIGPIDVVFQAADQLQADVIARINATLGYTAAADSGAGVTTISGRVGGTGGEVDITVVDVLVGTATGFIVGTDTGTGNVVNILNTTVAEFNTIVSTIVLSPAIGDRDVQGRLRLCNADTSLATLSIDATSTAIGLGFAIPSSTDVTDPTDPLNADGTIPAGTRVRNVGGTEWVTTQDLAVLASSRGPYTVKVRHGLDDTAGVAALVGTVVVLPFPIGLGGFDAVNLLPLSVALTDFQIDAAYVQALPSTKVVGTVADEASFVVSARQSNAIRVALKQNALDASAEGALGRKAIIRPPLGTARAVAKSAAQPGVGAYRDQRVYYAYPGVQTYISQIAALGAVSGGVGFTDDGIVDTGFDGFVANVVSQLPPEENPGQATPFLVGVLGIEAGNLDTQELELADYKSFRANGIMAPRLEGGTAFIQSGVTSVNPVLQPNLRNAARRQMADFIQDSLARRLKNFGKKLSTRNRRAAVKSETRQFLSSLQSDERIDSFSVVESTTVAQLALGLYRLITKAKTFPSLDSIVLETTIGESVVIINEV